MKTVLNNLSSHIGYAHDGRLVHSRLTRAIFLIAIGLVAVAIWIGAEQRTYCVISSGTGLTKDASTQTCVDQMRIGHWLIPTLPGSVAIGGD